MTFFFVTIKWDGSIGNGRFHSNTVKCKFYLRWRRLGGEENHVSNIWFKLSVRIDFRVAIIIKIFYIAIDGSGDLDVVYIIAEKLIICVEMNMIYLAPSRNVNQIFGLEIVTYFGSVAKYGTGSAIRIR